MYDSDRNFDISTGNPAFSSDQMSMSEIEAMRNSNDAPVYRDYKMKWYKFLIYVVLILGPIIDLYNGIMAVTGNMKVAGTYQTVTISEIYPIIPEYEVLVIFMGVVCFAIIPFALYVRSRLVHYRRNALAMLIAYYAVNFAFTLITAIWTFIIISGYITMTGEYAVDFFIETLAGSIISTAIMIPLNIVYFNKRRELFTA